MSNDVNKHVMVKHGHQFGELCEPIFKATQINYVGLARLYKDGARSYLISNPEWGKVLLENKYHLAGTEDALLYGPEFSHQLWHASSMFTLNEKTQNLFKDCVANNYGNGITLIERANDFVEFFHICTNSGYERVDPFLENNIDILWNYVLYIRESLAKNKELKNAYNKKYQYNLISFDGNSQLNSKPNSELHVRKYYLGGYFGDVYFTTKEMDCMILLYQNKNINEMARILNLSSRTIEAYLENIRLKISCPTKTALVLELSRNNLFKSFARNNRLASTTDK